MGGVSSRQMAQISRAMAMSVRQPTKARPLMIQFMVGMSFLVVCVVARSCWGVSVCRASSELRDPPGGLDAVGTQDGVVVGRSGGRGLVAGLGQSGQRGDVAHGAGGQEGAGLVGSVGQLAVGGQLVQTALGGAGQTARLRHPRWEQIGGEQLGDRQDGCSGLRASEVVGVVGRGHEGLLSAFRPAAGDDIWRVPLIADNSRFGRNEHKPLESQGKA